MTPDSQLESMTTPDPWRKQTSIKPPTGTITFLFTDIEGSTRLWEDHSQAMQNALARHDALLRQSLEASNGYVFKTVGDAFCAAFVTASQALDAALSLQRALSAEAWDAAIGRLKVRTALHTGVAEERDGDYFGPSLNRVARLLSVMYGGQILLSQTTRDLVQDHLPANVTLLDLGERQLKDLARTEHVYQVNVPDLPAAFPPIKSLETVPNNLPARLTSFIGREREIVNIKAKLADNRLVTLTGAGGVGKTRLTQEVAAAEIANYPDGIWFIELAPLANPQFVTSSIGTVLGLQERGGQPMLTLLRDFLRTRTILLILDNCEHLIAECARVADTLLRHCLHVSILASSREALGIGGECLIRVPSLSVPDRQALASTVMDAVSMTEQYEAVQLFIERARIVQPHFALTKDNTPALLQVCSRLDGIPLALELAAVRVKVLSVEQIASRLDNSFRLLTGGSRTALPRQQTLRALIDWSYGLLSDNEKCLLRRLAVFAGGWTLNAAETVCADDILAPDEVLDLLEQLVNKSLVTMDDQPGEARYRFLETIRQYAQEVLVQSREMDAIRYRHAQWCVGLAEVAEGKLKIAEQVKWLHRLDTEHDNLRAGIGWALEHGEADTAGRIAGGIGQFWIIRGYLSEGRRWLERVLAQSGLSVPVRLKALSKAMWIADYQGDGKQTALWRDELEPLARDVGDPIGIADALSYRASAAIARGEFDVAKTFLDERIALMQGTGDPWQLGLVFSNIAIFEQAQGNFEKAKASFEQGLAIQRSIGNRVHIALGLEDLARLALYQNDAVSAKYYFEEGMAVRDEWGHRRGLDSLLAGLGWATQFEGDAAKALQLAQQGLTLAHDVGERLGIFRGLMSVAGVAKLRAETRVVSVQIFSAARAFRAATNLRQNPLETAFYDRHIADVKMQLGEQEFNAAWADGQSLPLERAIELARQLTWPETQSAPPAKTIGVTSNPDQLTARELEVLRLVAQGLTNAQIGKELVISAGTVNVHLNAIYGKLGVNSRTAATRHALDHKLI